MNKTFFFFSTALFGLIGLFLCGSAAAFDYQIEFATNNNSTNNLLDDSSKIYDAYTTTTLKLKAYPLSSLELTAGGEHSYYRNLTGLSNLTGQIGFTFLPISNESPFALKLLGNFAGTRYHSAFSGFDNNVGNIEVTAGYDITPEISSRIGISYSKTEYNNLVVDDKNDLEYFLGGYVSLPGDIGFDVEAGYAKANYTSIVVLGSRAEVDPIGLLPVNEGPQSLENLWMLYSTLRLSRIVAPRTGLSINFTNKNFQNYHGQLIFGLGTSFLSPWASVWEGQSITANAKSFIIPRIILTAGAGYWDKTYMRTIEKDYHFYAEFWLDEPNIKARQDWQRRYYAAVQWPFSFKSGLFIEPSLRLDYTKNESNQRLYFYSDYSISAMITFRY